MIRESQRRWLEENKEYVKDYHSRYYLNHRDNALSKSKQYYRDNISIKKAYHQGHYLQKTYGMTIDEYNELFKLQNGVCAICHREETNLDRSGNIRRLSVDHDHETGKIRELLCDNCNKTLGYVGDDIDLLQGFIEYLVKHGK